MNKSLSSTVKKVRLYSARSYGLTDAVTFLGSILYSAQSH